MRQAQLEERTLMELRSIATAMGARFDFGDNRDKLMTIIREEMAVKVPTPKPLDEIKPADHRTSLRPPRFVCTEADVVDGLQPYTTRGLVLSFPTEDQWHISFGLREDSGTLNAPLLHIIRCAKELMK